MIRQWIPAARNCVVGNVGIVTATESDLKYIEHAQKKHHEAIGFVPKSAMENRIERRDYLKIDVNGQEAGFLLIGGGTRTPIRISQIMVDEELWRRGVGRASIGMIQEYALTMPKQTIVGRCAEGLTVNELVLATGARRVQVEAPKNKRKRRIFYYQWWEHTQPHVSQPQDMGDAQPQNTPSPTQPHGTDHVPNRPPSPNQPHMIAW